MSASVRLATYGTLAPGEINHHQLETLDGTWSKGIVKGRLVEAGWGAQNGCPGMVIDPDGQSIEVHIFQSDDLPDHWARLDEFEGSDYRRIVTKADTKNGELEVSIYEVIV